MEKMIESLKRVGENREFLRDYSMNTVEIERFFKNRVKTVEDYEKLLKNQKCCMVISPDGKLRTY